MTRFSSSPEGDGPDEPLARGGSEWFGRLATSLAMAGDTADEHWRWTVYERAVRSPELFSTLRRAVEAEQDPVVAVGVALAMLEHEAVDPAQWIAAVPAMERRRVEHRASERLARGHVADDRRVGQGGEPTA